MEHKQVFRRLNLDKDPMALGPDEFTYLKNGAPLQSHDGHDYAVGSVLGNVEIANDDLPTGTNTIVGEHEDTVNNRIFFLVHNSSSADNHTLYMMDSSYVFTRVMRNAVLDLALGRFYDMDMVGDILCWTDGVTEIKKINIAKAIAGGIYTPSALEITLLKRPPMLPLVLETGLDEDYDANHIKDNYFQFYWQFIYEDYDESAWGPFSRFARPSRASATGYDHNYITVNIPESIPASVRQVNFAVRINGSNEMFIYLSQIPSEVASNHRFYNNEYLSTVPTTDALLWNHSVPRTSRSIKLFKNRLFVFNNKEGYTVSSNKISGFKITANNEATSFGMSHKKRGIYTWGLMFFDAFGRHAGVHLGDNETTVTFADRSKSEVVLRSLANFDLSEVAQASIPLWATHYAIVRTQCKNISFFVSHMTADIIPVVKKDSDGSYGFQPNYNQTAGKAYIAIDVSGLIELGIGYVFQSGDRIRLWDPDYDNDNGFDRVIDAEINFQDGRFVFVTPNYEDPAQQFFFENNDVVHVDIPNFVQFWNFEIYRAKQNSIPLFYEIGHKYSITDAGTGFRAFSVTSGEMEGDVEIWNRRIFIRGNSSSSEYDRDNPLTTGTLRGSDEEALPLEITSSKNFEMMNAHDKNFDVWAMSVPGRSLLFSMNPSLEIQRTNGIRFSQLYNVGSEVSRLNIFYETDEYTQIPLKNGPGIKLQDADNILAAICQNETTAMYIGEAFVNTADGNQFLAKTDNVIGDDRKYFGGHGTLHPESVREYGGRVYFFDMTKGVVVRRSNDGLTRISDYGIATWIKKFSRDNFANRANMRFPGGYDPVYGLYLLSAIASNGTVLWTIGFHEDSNSWFGFYDYLPQLYSKLNGYLISFNGGKVWIHNDDDNFMNFYGVQKQRDMEFAVAVKGWREVTWRALNIDADPFHDNEGTNDDVVLITNDGAGFINSGLGGQYTTITHNELQLRRGVYRSAIFRDINTPQPFDPAIRAKFEGNPMSGQMIRVKVLANKTDVIGRIRSIGILYDISQGDMKGTN